MMSPLQSPTSTRDLDYLDLVSKPLRVDFSARYLVPSPDPSKITVRGSLTNISNIVHCSPTMTSVVGTFADELSSLWPSSHSSTHPNRVATVDHHDTDAWTRERKVHDSKLNTIAVPSSLGPNGIVPGDFVPIEVAKSRFAIMELQTEWLRTVGQSSNAGQLCGDTAVPQCNWASLVAPGSGISPVWPYDAIVPPCSREDLAGGRHRVGEILVRCGVIDVSGMLMIEPAAIGCGSHNLDSHPIDVPVISGVTAEMRFVGENESLITALAEWTSEWVHTLVVQPYLRGIFRFQYQGKPSRASTSVAQRIHRVLNNVENPVQVAIHALWLIGALMGNSACDNAPFLSVPIFRYLHHNGTFVAEDFMFRAFVTCAMIGDKTVNDATLSTNTWHRLTRIPQVILNATEKYALSCLKWNVVMTPTQWQDTITYLRSCIKMSSAFDPFSYEGNSPSNIMARYLDELVDISHVGETYFQQKVFAAETQSIRHSTHSEVFSTTEWCPENDPVINQKPRTIGIAPGADQNSNTLEVGATAKDLLDSTLGISSVPDLAHLVQPAGTSFRGSFGVIGARLAHTIRTASACQSASWIPSGS